MQSSWRLRASVFEPSRHRIGDGAADAGVDLVEDQDRRLADRAAVSALSASMMRDSSPPDAMRASGFGRLAGVGGRGETRRCRAPSALERARPASAAGRRRHARCAKTAPRMPERR